MKLSEYKKKSDDNTSKASEITRQLILAGIAIIWLFKTKVKDVDTLDTYLLIPLCGLCLALISDLLQYVFAGEIWRQFFREQEKNTLQKIRNNPNEISDPDIKAPAKKRNLLFLFYWGKIILMLFSYMFIVVYCISKINFS